jgi:NAD+ synthase
MARAERIAGWMRGQLAAAGARGFLVGLSGGVDSAVGARLAQLAAPGAALGVLLPCHSDPADEADALQFAQQFSLPTATVDLSAPYDALVAQVQAAAQALPRDIIGGAVGGRLPLANIKPRLRMTTLYHFANALGYLVAGTSNRSEIAIGYFTKYGYGAADLLPIGHLVKRDVLALGRDLNIAPSLVERRPSAGLWLGQSDEEELGFSYAELERYLDQGPQGVPPALAMRIERLIRSSEHKRAVPPMPND